MINNLYSCLSSLDRSSQDKARFYFCTHENTVEITKTRSTASNNYVLLSTSPFPPEASISNHCNEVMESSNLEDGTLLSVANFEQSSDGLRLPAVFQQHAVVLQLPPVNLQQQSVNLQQLAANHQQQSSSNLQPLTANLQQQSSELQEPCANHHQPPAVLPLPGNGLELSNGGLQIPHEEIVGMEPAEDDTELVNSLAELDTHLVEVEGLCEQTINFHDPASRGLGLQENNCDGEEDEPESSVGLSAEEGQQNQNDEAVSSCLKRGSREASATADLSPASTAFRYKCDYCPYATNKKSNCAMHVRCVHLKEKFACHICDKQVANLNQHMRMAHQIYKTEGEHCSLCNKSTHNLESHNSKTHNIRVQNDVRCQICSKEFVHRSNLVRHLATHNNAKFYCQRCDLHVSELSKHNSSFHPLPSGYPFVCGICGLEFTKKSVLLSHRQKHGEKASKAAEKLCNICNKHFANINQHIKIVHKKIKNFECVNCKKKFYDKRELRNHHLQYLKNGVCIKQVASSGEAKFQCNLCQYKTYKRFNLRMHQQSVHLGVKYTCEACGKVVSSKPNLSLHIKNCGEYTSLHGASARDAGRIMFLCKLCEYETTRASHLDRHILSVHPTEAVETVTSVYEASKTVPSMYGPGPETSRDIENITSKHLKLPQFANLAHLETSRLPGMVPDRSHQSASRRLPTNLRSFAPPHLQELAGDEPSSAATQLEEDPPVSRAEEIATEEFVNPAQLINHNSSGSSCSGRHQLRDLTIGQARQQPHPQLMDLSGGSSSNSQLMPDQPRSPLGSPSAGLMSLGDFAAPEDAALFSLPLPLGADINA